MGDEVTRVRGGWIDEAGQAVYDALVERQAQGGHICASNLDHLVREGTEKVRQSLTAAVILFTADLEDQ